MLLIRKGSGYSVSAAQSNLFEVSEKITTSAYFSEGGDILYFSFTNDGNYLPFIRG